MRKSNVLLKRLIAASAALCMVAAIPAVNAFALNDDMLVMIGDDAADTEPQKADTDETADTAETAEEGESEEAGQTDDTTPVYLLSAEAEINTGTDKSYCYVGDVIEVDLFAINTGNSPLTNVRFFFEDQEVYFQETLGIGESAEKTIKLQAAETDIGTGRIALSFTADELEAPVEKEVTIEVRAAEEDEEEQQESEEQQDTKQEEAQAEPAAETASQPQATAANTDNPPTGGVQAAFAAAAALVIFTAAKHKKR